MVAPETERVPIYLGGGCGRRRPGGGQMGIFGKRNREHYKKIDDAVLTFLNPQFKCNSVGVEIGSDVQEDVTQELTLIKKYRGWLKTQTDPDVRAAYKKWLDFYEGQALRAQKALDSGARQRWEARCQRDQEEYDESLRNAEEIPKPDFGRATWEN